MSREIIESIMAMVNETKEKSLEGGCRFVGDLILPIEKIDGMPCQVRLNLWVGNITLYIESKKIVENGTGPIHYFGEGLFDERGDLTEEKVVGCLVKLKKILKMIYFDKMTGVFRKNKNKQIDWCEFLNDLVEEKKIVLYTDKCSVCLDMTKTRTPCKHHLCLMCWEQIPRKHDEDIEMPCPICRADIRIVDEYELRNVCEDYDE